MRPKAMTWRDRVRDRLRHWPYAGVAMKVLLWWVIGIWVSWSFAGNNTSGLGAGYFLGGGAFLGATFEALYWAVNRYRTERKLTWTQLSGRAIVLVLVWGVVAGLARMDHNDWSRVTPVLLVIGFYAAYVAAGLLVLYLAVRVIRVAWMGPVTAMANALTSQLAQRDAKIDELATELSERYEEINLLYTVSETIGHTTRLDEAAQRILTEVSTVVRARRATLLVHDAEQRVLRLVAARGMDPKTVDPIEVDDPCSVAARVFREGRIVSYDPTDAKAVNPGCPEGRDYHGKAFLSVPVLYAAPGARAKPIGVINLTDRLGEDAFTAGDRKLVAAIANQIGAAIENARLVAQDLGQQRVRRELELARDLQLKLLPSPLVLAARVDVAARCRQADSVGGDFYNLLNLRAGRIGVRMGDVTNHGFGAALIMALVMAASGIHAESAETPTEVLRRLEESLTEELANTEMFLTVFYAVVDPQAGRITFGNEIGRSSCRERV